jgi:hypothetical protein
MLVPLLDRPIDGGGDGPPALREPGGNPFMAPLDPPEFGGEMSWPRLFVYGPSLSKFWYFDMPDHAESLPPKETGESGTLRPFMVGAGERMMSDGWSRMRLSS